MRSLRRVGLAAGIIVLASLVAVGVLTGVLGSGVDRALQATGLRTAGSTGTPGAAATVTPSADPGSAASSMPPAPSTPSSGSADTAPSPVLVAATGEADVSKAALAKRIDAVSGSGFKADIGIAVAPLEAIGSLRPGSLLYGRNAGTGFTPASTNKLLTSATALRLLGPDHRFTTTVVTGSTGQIILVGGGDPYLSATTVSSAYPVRPSLQQLAVSTAAGLKSRGESTVTLGYDTSLFTGPSWSPQWPETYRDQVSPVSALWVNEGRDSPYETGPRVQNAPLVAAKAFAAQLKKNGITVRSVSSARAPKSATTLASLRSLPLNLIVERLLMLSDNDAAEVVLRQAAIAAKQPASFAGGVKAVRAQLSELGLADDAIRTDDGSGLSRATRVPPQTLVALVALAAADDHPELRPLLTGMPIAGAAGSLSAKFNTTGTTGARGLARAKTGTLSKVHALAGYVRTPQGTSLAFDVVVNDASNDYLAELYLERVVGAISACGCTG